MTLIPPLPLFDSLSRPRGWVMVFLIIAIGLVCLTQTGWAQVPGTIVTFAGGGTGDGGLATAASIGTVFGVFGDGVGNLYIADINNHRIRRIAPNGIITTVAGNGSGDFSGDGGPATVASLSPIGIFMDRVGNLYIVDNQRIRKADTSGMIITVAGTGNIGFSGDDGPATAADLNYPLGVFGDDTGNVYIADTNNHRIRKVDASGIITTIAGSGVQGSAGDGGPAIYASLNTPHSVFVDRIGNVYIADSDNNHIRKVDPNGIIATVAGIGAQGFAGDGGPATAASLSWPLSVFGDGAGNLYITDTSNNRIRKVTPDGIITTVAGNGSIGFSGDGGPATAASLYYPTTVFVDGTGNLYIADYSSYRIRKVDPDGIITTVAGNGSITFSGDGGPATAARLNTPQGVFADGAGNLYIADTENHRIRKMAPGGMITTVAGTGVRGFGEDGGPATTASLNFPVSVCVDGAGNLYIADTNSHRIRKVDAGGVITTIAGDGYADPFSSPINSTGRFTEDGGPATAASLNRPSGVFVDRASNLYIADTENHRIRKVDARGVITTVAGRGGSGYGGGGFSGDGGLATEATLTRPSGVFVDRVGNVYIADRGNTRIRKVDPNGIITTVAGTGAQGFTGDGGPATTASLDYIKGVFGDGTGNLYIVDYNNHRIRKVDTQGIMTTIVGTGLSGRGNGSYTGDGGPATVASLNLPTGIGVDGAGNVYIADAYNHRIRKIIGAGTQALLALNTQSLSLGQVEIGAFKDTTITITNIGTDTLRVFAITSSNPVFTIKSTTFMVPPGQSVIDTLRFTPTAIGPMSGTLVVESNVFTSPYTVTVSAVGVEVVIPSIPIDLPTTFALHQNYPNPFNPETTIRFDLPTPSKVTLRIYNLLGQEVVTLLNGEDKPAGYYTIRWNGRDRSGRRVGSGLYVYRLEAGTFIKTKKMMLVR